MGGREVAKERGGRRGGWRERGREGVCMKDKTCK